ncbi:MAG: cation-transporting P-type ATPase [Candidatus Thermoplasmatota archaeon]|nr:cation-transporting P-type ATPase [Candidatus Thermoplasmatota archaeon]MBS3789959.1 cation-transporting P-type ATPase [Candidatus Thermoplasmatota archaeon]
MEKPWSKSIKQVLDHHRVDKEKGLNEKEVKNRRKKFGRNKLKEAKKKSRWKILVEQFKSFLVILLGVAAIISLLIEEVVEGISILAVLVVNAIIGFVTEARAVSSMEALREMTRIDTHVRRRAGVKKIPAKDLVPGDIVTLQSGDMVPADLRVIEASKLQVDEAALTGESIPVSKRADVIEKKVPLAERENMLYKGTYLTRGTAEGVVVSTGTDTELGQISASIEEVEEETTPLEKKLNKLGQKLIPLLIVVAGIVGVSGIIRGMDPYLMIETAIALAIATVPEGLPIVATLVLARGMLRMAKQNALLSRLSSVETLGSTNIICSDKTGTLTENRMTVNRYEMEDRSVEITGTGLDTEGEFVCEGEEKNRPDDPVLRESLKVGVLCNNASINHNNGEKEIMGDPLEVSLLIAGMKGGLERDQLLEHMPESKEISFDPAVKMMATYHEQETGGYKVAVKGAPESVLERSSRIMTSEGTEELTSERKEKWMQKNERMAEDGLRILALAKKEVESTEEEPYEGLTFLGLVGMMDPPRKEVKHAIKKCQDAGIRVVMVTGDHAATAKNVGYSLGLLGSGDIEVIEGSELEDPERLDDEQFKRFVDAPIFARVNPENKLDLIEIHQENGSIVAMTGDGVNDAPALKKADIGIAMGERGTQVAKEAADMILQDDNFSTIERAVEEGRTIFNNIRKFVVYLISCNISELLAILIASILGFPLPLLPLQILFLNVVNDVFPAFALGACRGSEDIMDVPPRDPQEPILTRTNWYELGFYGLMIAVATVASMGLAGEIFPVQMSNYKIVTISFLTLAFAQLWHVFNMRGLTSDILKNEVTKNKYVWGALGLCTLILVAAVYLPGISHVLRTEDPGLVGWILVIGMSLIPLFIGQVERELRERFNGKN